MALFRSASAELALLLAWSVPAPAQVQGERYMTAVLAILKYAAEIRDVMPCAYVAIVDNEGTRDLVEGTYGATAVRGTVDNYVKGGGTAEEGEQLMKLFTEHYKVNWKVDDIRTFAQTCARDHIFKELMTFSGRGTPLQLRPPFREDPH
jgi:hypothetical protein